METKIKPDVGEVSTSTAMPTMAFAFNFMAFYTVYCG